LRRIPVLTGALVRRFLVCRAVVGSLLAACL